MKHRQEAKGTPRMTVKRWTMTTPVFKTCIMDLYILVHKDRGFRKTIRMDRLSDVQKISLRGCWRMWKELAMNS